ncbi:YybH family protein [Tenacibaculum caenipelagi]|uniref:Ketosteroid isomerase-like protein n=1 Tax=Tenacibaculum caenipelagi TaxID=1325435 RepID=A0A4R6TDL5_9FLAO|nr:nuclear transport factor 2 family protein [Tenacibaculum caenipelagi]TDQ27568.1 ketosteroid isomerase-like protein [Tenacibaculum caenipelagi]
MKKLANFSTKLTLTLFLILFITSCNNKPTKDTESTNNEPVFDLNTAKTEIEAANKAYSDFFAAKDSVGLANLYSEEGKFMMNGSPSIVGRPSIQSIFYGFINSDLTSLDLKTIDVWGTQNLVTEEGAYTLYSGDKKVDEGKYLVLWTKENGKWLLHRDIFNSDMPTE